MDFVLMDFVEIIIIDVFFIFLRYNFYEIINVY